MKKVLLFIVILSVLVFALSGISYGWQGRMAGMGDPYGLISDESDFLIHPAKIVGTEGTRFYGGYRFTYAEVADWESQRAVFSPTGVFSFMNRYDFTGGEYGHEALVGTAFPLGQGRLGIFFSYDGMRGDYDVDYPVSTIGGNFEMESDLDAFALRLVYGLPLDGFSLGGEIQLAYRQEENQSLYYWDNLIAVFSNSIFFDFSFFPYDSSYVEALLKGSLEGAIGPVETAFTLRGGLILGGGGNEWEERDNIPRGWDLAGNVEGWQIGGDLWARYPLSDNLALPFLVRIDYQDKSRDGDGAGLGTLAGYQVDYEHTEQGLEIVVGGGLDREFAAGARSAVGIYYHYLQGKNDLSLYSSDVIFWSNDNLVLPDGVEHRVMVRFVGERELSPAVALRGGLDCFYGWVQQERAYTGTDSLGGLDTEIIPTDGPHWGIGASLGGSVRFQRLTLEPFVGVGYQALDIAGDGAEVRNGVLTGLREYDESRDEWFVNGGISLTWGSQGQGAERMSADAVEPDAGEQFATAHQCPQCGRTFPAEYVYCPFDKTALKTIQVKK